MAKKQPAKIEITTATIVKAISLVLILLLLLKVWEILASLFLAIVIAAAIEPTLRWLDKIKIPRIVSVPLFFILSLGAFLGIFYAILPGLFSEIFILSQSFSERYGEALSRFVNSPAFDNIGFLVPAIDEFFTNFQSQIGGLVPDLFNFISTLFGGLFSFFVVFVFSFYLSLRKNDIEKAALSITPDSRKEYVKDLIRRMQRRTGRWLQAMFVLSTFVGVATFIVMYLLGVPFALTLGLAAGLLEIMPFIGPFIAGALIFLIASSESAALGVAALGAFIILQQLEQMFIAPSVMSRAISMSPLAIIIAVLVGAEIAGLWGIIVAIPLAAAVGEFARDVKNGHAR